MGNIIITLYQSRLIRLSAWYTLANIAIRALGFLLIPVYAFLLTPDQFGVTALVLTWAGLFTIGSSLYLYAVPERARADYDDSRYNNLISSITTLGLVSSTSVVVILALLPDSFFTSLFGLSKLMAIAAALAVPLSIPYRINLARWQGEARARQYTWLALCIEITTAVTSVLFIVAPGLFNLSLDEAAGRIIGVLVARALFGLFYLSRTLNGTFYRREYWEYALRYAIPLIPHALAGELLANYDRVLIAQYYSERETGIYSVIYQFGTVIALLAATSAAAWGPWFYRNMTDKRYIEVRGRISKYVLGFTAITCVAVLVWPQLSRFIVPTQYGEGLPIIPVIMASGYFIFLHYFFLYIETQERKTWFASIATLLTVAINIGLNAYFLPRAGYLAAGWITLISYIFLFFAHVVVVRLYLKNDQVNDLRMMVGSGFLVVFVAYLSHQFILQTR